MVIYSQNDTMRNLQKETGGIRKFRNKSVSYVDGTPKDHG